MVEQSEENVDVQALVKLLTYSMLESHRLGLLETARQIEQARDEIPDLERKLLSAQLDSNR